MGAMAIRRYYQGPLYVTEIQKVLYHLVKELEIIYRLTGVQVNKVFLVFVFVFVLSWPRR